VPKAVYVGAMVTNLNPDDYGLRGWEASSVTEEIDYRPRLIEASPRATIVQCPPEKSCQVAFSHRRGHFSSRRFKLTSLGSMMQELPFPKVR
jgi:hypothetical protein